MIVTSEQWECVIKRGDDTAIFAFVTKRQNRLFGLLPPKIMFNTYVYELIKFDFTWRDVATGERPDEWSFENWLNDEMAAWKYREAVKT